MKRLVLFILFISVLTALVYWAYMGENRGNKISKSAKDFGIDQTKVDEILNAKNNKQSSAFEPWMPHGKGELIQKKSFALSYREDHKLAEWVSYHLTKEIIQKPNFERNGYFAPDPDVSTGTSDYYDFSGSGFIRGHLVPVADMSWDELSMKETFYLSNISPQAPKFNEGIWKELEETVRDWAYTYKDIFVVSGPLLEGEILKKIGESRMSVPKYYYKAIWVNDAAKPRSIAFILPNETSTRRLQDYSTTVDELEKLSKIDFFPEILNDNLEETIESALDLDSWKFSEQRYYLRINYWNK